MVGAEAHPGFYITQGYKWGLSTSPTGWKMPPFRFFSAVDQGWPAATHGGLGNDDQPNCQFLRWCR